MFFIDVLLREYHKNNKGVPFLPNSENKINYSILAEILGINSKQVTILLKWLQEKDYIHINTAKEEVKVCVDVDSNIDTTIVYYEGDKYLSAFRQMNRYLSK